MSSGCVEASPKSTGTAKWEDKRPRGAAVIMEFPYLPWAACHSFVA